MSWWNDERVAELKQLWAAGLSASQVAVRLGTTRNAVLSKIHSLGLPKRLTVYASPRSQRAKFVRPPQFILEPQLPLPLNRKGVQELEEHDCRWPIGDPRSADFYFCAARRVSGLPYCESHCRRAFEPPQPRRAPIMVRVQGPAEQSKPVEEVA